MATGSQPSRATDHPEHSGNAQMPPLPSRVSLSFLFLDPLNSFEEILLEEISVKLFVLGLAIKLIFTTCNVSFNAEVETILEQLQAT